LRQNFIEPLCHYYTPVNTVVYGIILVAAALGIYKLLENMNIKIDKRFFIAFLPFIIYGGWTRALRDHNLYQGWYFCSPPIYFVLFGIGLGCLLLGIFLQRKFRISYYKVVFAMGVFLLVYNATLTTITNWAALSIIAFLVAVWSVTFFGISKLKPNIISIENAGITVAHLLDASASFTAIQFFGYSEQHVLPGFLISFLGPWVMFPLKILVVPAVLYILDRKTEDIQFRNFLKFIILILGLALRTRDTLTVSMLNV